MRKALSTLACGIGRQRWLRFGIRDRIIRRIEHPDFNKGVDFNQRFCGGTYTGNTGHFIDWSARYYGSYSGAELALFADCLPAMKHMADSPPVVLDVGANVGHHTLFYALMGATGIAFEPNPQTARQAITKLEANTIKSWRIEQVALSDHHGTMRLHLPKGHNSGIASLENDYGMESIPVEVIPGDDCKAIQSLPRIDYIKIDVEGHEPAVLSGLRKTLKRERPFVFLEWNCKTSFEQVFDDFPGGYSFWAFSSDHPRLFVFNSPAYRLKRLGRSGPGRAMNVLAVPQQELPPRLARHQAAPGRT